MLRSAAFWGVDATPDSFLSSHFGSRSGMANEYLLFEDWTALKLLE
jgi:hypothetical protein